MQHDTGGDDESPGPLTKAIDFLFRIVEKRTRDAYRLSPGVVVYPTRNANEELFPLPVVPVNSLQRNTLTSAIVEVGPGLEYLENSGPAIFACGNWVIEYPRQLVM
jgi:hypothetical protein